MENLVIYNENRQPVTNSLLVAEKFGKKHKHVIEAIKNIIQSAQNSAHFYQSATYVDSRNRNQEMIIMNRDGFTLLGMGFTGQEAMQMKVAYIEAFNKLYEENKRLREQQFKAFGGYDIAADFNESVRSVELRGEISLSLVDVLKFIRSGSNASDVSKRHPDIGAFKMRYPGITQAEYFANTQGIGYLLKHYSKLGNKTAKALWNIVFTDVPMKGLN